VVHPNSIIDIDKQKGNTTMENMGARYNISHSLPAGTFTNPAPRNTKDMGYEIKGNQVTRKAFPHNAFDSPIEPQVNEGTVISDIAEGFQANSTGARMPDFHTGRNSGQGIPEENSAPDGPGTYQSSETTLPEIGEETSLLGDVAGLAELL
jgi:hypothetical protein